MTPYTIRHAEQYAGRYMIVVAEDIDGLFCNAFQLCTLDPVLLNSRGFPSIDHAINTARRMVDIKLEKYES